ncbi:PilN domain-containing protein [Thioflexithrix psekupsensis]|uniref:GspL cytoplasmic actin-ATPase-like domain-containing protein n=1 Tax=Thioflexithrix psekupsensis TaxID=1570016 RepID=A0A251XB35_9GAMM|nr:PilN domain-containing protein [Thioflexithrix psekupsensis]OUD15310.1 hypothetical protein TPSD3_01915 [Thioflexithrix psekupsensis]
MKLKLSFPKRFIATKPHRPQMIAQTCLLVHNNQLLHVEQPDLIAQHDESLLAISATELAAAARRLLPNTDEKIPLALALPNHEFIATPLTLPTGIGEQNLRSAVSLQQATLLPGLPVPLLLAVRPSLEAHLPTIALWLPASRAEELYQAFAKEKLFLAALFPRILLSIQQAEKTAQIWDEDEHSITYCHWASHRIQQWIQVAKTDLELEEFKNQFEELLKKNADENDKSRIWKIDSNDWDKIPMPNPTIYQYSFTPPSTLMRLAQQRQQQRRRTLLALASAAAMSLLLGVAAAAAYQYHLTSQLDELKRSTRSISQLQAEVVAMEDDIAPVINFPQPPLVEILNRLNQVIPKDSWFTGFRIDAGVIELEGYSPNPSHLLEILSNDPMFTGVTFNQQIRAEGGRTENRFGIRLLLPEINIAQYWQTYFPVE